MIRNVAFCYTSNIIAKSIFVFKKRGVKFNTRVPIYDSLVIIYIGTVVSKL